MGVVYGEDVRLVVHGPLTVGAWSNMPWGQLNVRLLPVTEKARAAAATSPGVVPIRTSSARNPGCPWELIPGLGTVGTIRTSSGGAAKFTVLTHSSTRVIASDCWKRATRRSVTPGGDAIPAWTVVELPCLMKYVLRIRPKETWGVEDGITSSPRNTWSLPGLAWIWKDTQYSGSFSGLASGRAASKSPPMDKPVLGSATAMERPGGWTMTPGSATHGAAKPEPPFRPTSGVAAR